METGLGRPERDAQGACHVRQGHPEEVVQDDDRPPLWIEMSEGVVEQLTVGDGRGDVADRRAVDRGQLDLGEGNVVAIILDDSSSVSRFDELVTQAMPIVESFTFK